MLFISISLTPMVSEDIIHYILPGASFINME